VYAREAITKKNKNFTSTLSENVYASLRCKWLPLSAATSLVVDARSAAASGLKTFSHTTRYNALLLMPSLEASRVAAETHCSATTRCSGALLREIALCRAKMRVVARCCWCLALMHRALPRCKALQRGNALRRRVIARNLASPRNNAHCRVAKCDAARHGISSNAR